MSEQHLPTYLFHVTRTADWESARSTGRYEISTRGRTLAEEGFIHCSHEHQWRGVLDAVYAGTTDPLTLLVIDAERLTSPVVEETAPDGTAYPHVYGPIDLDAVVTTVPVSPPPAVSAPNERSFGGKWATPNERSVADAPVPTQQPSFARLMVTEMAFNAALLLAVMVCSFVVSAAAGAAFGDGARLPGAVVGLVIGIVAGVPVYRRRSRRRE